MFRPHFSSVVEGIKCCSVVCIVFLVTLGDAFNQVSLDGYLGGNELKEEVHCEGNMVTVK